MKPPIKLANCRICSATDLDTILDLGTQALTGVFPEEPGTVPSGPVQLVKCARCHLVQLAHDYDPSDLYGSNYGYRSGLNASMVAHLRKKVSRLQQVKPLVAGDTVIDIGSNDGTLLGGYSEQVERIGYDPTGPKFARFYAPGIKMVPDFFRASEKVQIQAKIITAIAMFYDLPNPRMFLADVVKCLAPDGIFHAEMAYLPAILRTGSYDTVVVEHLEYYSLTVIQRLFCDAGMEIIDVETNGINGGSFAITATHATSSQLESNAAVIDWMLEQEDRMGLKTMAPYQAFQLGAIEHRRSLISLIKLLRDDGKQIVGIGASTKGNCLLQYCGFTTDDIRCIIRRPRYWEMGKSTGLP